MGKEETKNAFIDKYKIEYSENLSERVISSILRIQAHIALNHKTEAENEYNKLEKIVSQYGEATLTPDALKILNGLREDFKKSQEKKKSLIRFLKNIVEMRKSLMFELMSMCKHIKLS